MAQLLSQADAPGKSREYETIFILSPDTPNDGIAKVNDRLKGIIDSMGGKVLTVDNWGKRKLAYEIAKQLKGIYLYWQYLGTTGLVDEIERNLRMLDSVIRYHTVKLDSNVDASARPSEMDDDAFARAAETAADEEDLIMGTGAAGDSDGDTETAASAEGEASAKSEGEASAKSEGEASAKSEGEASAKSEGEASAKSEGEAQTETATKTETPAETEAAGDNAKKD